MSSSHSLMAGECLINLVSNSDTMYSKREKITASKLANLEMRGIFLTTCS